MTTDRQAELARRREYERRMQMIAAAADAIQDDATSTRYETEAIAGRILDAILPQVTTVAELEMLPDYSALAWSGPTAGSSLLLRVVKPHGALRCDSWVGSFAQAIAELGSLTVVWQPEVTA